MAILVSWLLRPEGERACQIVHISVRIRFQQYNKYTQTICVRACLVQTVRVATLKLIFDFITGNNMRDLLASQFIALCCDVIDSYRFLVSTFVIFIAFVIFVFCAPLTFAFCCFRNEEYSFTISLRQSYHDCPLNCYFWASPTLLTHKLLLLVSIAYLGWPDGLRLCENHSTTFYFLFLL